MTDATRHPSTVKRDLEAVSGPPWVAYFLSLCSVAFIGYLMLAFGHWTHYILFSASCFFLGSVVGVHRYRRRKEQDLEEELTVACLAHPDRDQAEGGLKYDQRNDQLTLTRPDGTVLTIES